MEPALLAVRSGALFARGWGRPVTKRSSLAGKVSSTRCPASPGEWRLFMDCSHPHPIQIHEGRRSACLPLYRAPSDDSRVSPWEGCTPLEPDKSAGEYPHRPQLYMTNIMKGRRKM